MIPFDRFGDFPPPGFFPDREDYFAKNVTPQPITKNVTSGNGIIAISNARQLDPGVINYPSYIKITGPDTSVAPREPKPVISPEPAPQAGVTDLPSATPSEDVKTSPEAPDGQETPIYGDQRVGGDKSSALQPLDMGSGILAALDNAPPATEDDSSLRVEAGEDVASAEVVAGETPDYWAQNLPFVPAYTEADVYLSNQTPEGELLETIAAGEAPGGFNQRFGERAGANRYDLVNMTVSEVAKLPANRAGRYVSTASGKFQIIRKTLKGLIKNMGLTGEEKFDAAMQTRMAMELMEGRGLADFKAGKITREQFAYNLAKEWASLPNPYSGRSAYRQPVAHPVERILSLVDRLKTGPTTYAPDEIAKMSPEDVLISIPDMQTFRQQDVDTKITVLEKLIEGQSIDKIEYRPGPRSEDQFFPYDDTPIDVNPNAVDVEEKNRELKAEQERKEIFDLLRGSHGRGRRNKEKELIPRRPESSA